jgi:Tfp pilus assembly protein PilE
MRSNLSIYKKNSQQGSTLIAIMLILVMITIMGVIAMKQGLTSLNVATNAQVQSLLVQSADTVLNQVNQIAAADMSKITSLANVTGYALLSNDAGKEYVFCYRPTQADPFGLFINANTIHGNPGGVVTPDDIGGGGFCDLTAATDYGSGRKASITQVAVTKPLDTSSLPAMTYLNQGTNVSVGGNVPPQFASQQRLRVISTSMLPAFSASPVAAVQTDCLQNRVSDNTDAPLQGLENITDCLARKGMPANTQVQEYSLKTVLTSAGS